MDPNSNNTKNKSDRLQTIINNTIDAKNDGSTIIPVRLFDVAYQAGELLPAWWSRDRDIKLREVFRKCDQLKGAFYKTATRLSSVKFLIEPRDPTISSHRDLAITYNIILTQMPEFGQGYKVWLRKWLLDLWTQDNGAFSLIVGDGAVDTERKGIPLGLQMLDSFNCTRTGNALFPVLYRSLNGFVKIHYSRILYDSQQPSNEQGMNGVGHCWTTRAIDVSQNIIDMATFKQEKLGSRPSRQIILGQGGLSGEHIANAMLMADEAMDNQGLKRFAKKIVMGDSNAKDAAIQIVDLVNDDIFNERESIDINMFTIALTGGIPPRDLWPATTTGATRADATFQHITGSSGYTDILDNLVILLGGDTDGPSLLNKFLPKELKITYDFLDDDADKNQSEIKKNRAETWKINLDTGLISTRTAREQMVRSGDMTKSQFEREELEDGRLPDGDSVLTLFVSTKEVFISLLGLSQFDNITNIEKNKLIADEIIEAIDLRLIEINKVIANANRRVLLNNARQAKRALVELRKLYEDINVTEQPQNDQAQKQLNKSSISKQTQGIGLPDEVGDYEDDMEELIQLAQNGELNQEEFESQMEEIVLAALLILFLLGSGKTADELTQAEQDFIDEQIQTSLDSIQDLAEDVFSGKFIPSQDGGGGNNLLSRIGLWGGVAASIYYAGLTRRPGIKLEWVWNPDKDHCEDCQRLNGQVHTSEQWLDSGLYPKSTQLKCSGFNCGCSFVQTDKQTAGSF